MHTYETYICAYIESLSRKAGRILVLLAIYTYTDIYTRMKHTYIYAYRESLSRKAGRRRVLLATYIHAYIHTCIHAWIRMKHIYVHM